MPGITPACASSRRQIRQSPNFRYTARGRPQRLQREYCRVLYFCGLEALTVRLVFAISFSYSSFRKGRPSSRRSISASLSFAAVVVIATSSPRIASTSS